MVLNPKWSQNLKVEGAMRFGHTACGRCNPMIVGLNHSPSVVQVCGVSHSDLTYVHSNPWYPHLSARYELHGWTIRPRTPSWHPDSYSTIPKQPKNVVRSCHPLEKHRQKLLPVCVSLLWKWQPTIHSKSVTPQQRPMSQASATNFFYLKQLLPVAGLFSLSSLHLNTVPQKQLVVDVSEPREPQTFVALSQSEPFIRQTTFGMEDSHAGFWGHRKLYMSEWDDGRKACCIGAVLITSKFEWLDEGVKLFIFRASDTYILDIFFLGVSVVVRTPDLRSGGTGFKSRYAPSGQPSLSPLGWGSKVLATTGVTVLASLAAGGAVVRCYRSVCEACLLIRTWHWIILP